MLIAYTMPNGRGDADLLLQTVAETLIGDGLQPCGAVQVNTNRTDGGPCDMDVQVLPDGPVIRISQTLGKQAKGCRLDPNALEDAVGLVETSLNERTDCLIINKFGKHEADGGGFRSAIAQALSLDIPVLVGLNTMNAEAFSDFTGGIAVELPADKLALLSWLKHASTREHQFS